MNARPVVRDSSGVQIVENSGRAWSDESWTVSTQPLLTIGVVDGPPEYSLSLVRSAIRLKDGRIAVADGGSSSIRFYSSAGRFLSSSGRQGRGPGEYVDIGTMGRLPGDTLVVADGILQRISFLDASGAYVRSIGLELGKGFYSVGYYNVVGILKEGNILAYSGSGRGFKEEDAGRLIQDTLQFFWFGRTGEFGGRLTALPGAPRWGLRTVAGVSFPYVPFGGGPVSAVSRDRFVIGRGVEPELLVFDGNGELKRVIRWPARRRASSVEMDRLRDQMLGPERTSAQRNSNRRLLAEAPAPDSLPATRAVLVDKVGNIWVEQYRAPWESSPVWEIFNPDGRWLGNVRTPSRFRIHEIGSDYLLGTWRNDLDVEYLRMYGLDKRGL